MVPPSLRVLEPQSLDSFLNEFGDLSADFHSCRLLESEIVVEGSKIPRIKESGSFGASATNNPPNPHPISAISTFLVRVPTDFTSSVADDSSASGFLKLG